MNQSSFPKGAGLRISAGLMLVSTLLFHPISGSCAPADFPEFQVPGQEQTMKPLRDLYWLHYEGAGPKATLWDEWLSLAAFWPAVEDRGLSDHMRQSWRDALSARILDADGYLATHQHASIAHQLGWPFPFYIQGQGGFGWHYSFRNTVDANWRPRDLNTPGDWQLAGAKDGGTNQDGWRIEFTAPGAFATPPIREVDPYNAPFAQLRWSSTGLEGAHPFIEWKRAKDAEFSPERRMYFDPSSKEITYTMVPLYRHPEWEGRITGIRIGFDNPSASGDTTIQAFFSNYDTRHNINSQNFVRGCATYFWWTRDLAFLRKNMNRMRTAVRYMMTEHHTLERQVVFTSWVGHDGRAGFKVGAAGKKTFAFGHGIGNNYWDLLPFGNLDCYATMHYYDALRVMEQLEREIEAHPEWQVPQGALAFEPDFLKRHRQEVKQAGNRLFWNKETGRFVACVDADGKTHDYGLTFLNLEAVHYDFATPEHAKSIMSWIDEQRMVAGDTAQGADIYHWRFGPRATTRRNVDWYFWAWSGPESIPFGGQVQDGGAVLGFSYHDLMARLRVLGPDNTWNRLQEITKWFEEVQQAGGYRKYYDGKREGTLQGGGTAGGLGLDHEFFESVLVPQVMLYGFMGFQAEADAIGFSPRLPKDWPELRISRVRYQDMVLNLRVASSEIEIQKVSGTAAFPTRIAPPPGKWKVQVWKEDKWESIDSEWTPDGELKTDWVFEKLKLQR